MSRPQKKNFNEKVDFSDEEIFQQIKEQIREIKESGLKKIDEQTKINDLYLAHKLEKRKQKFRDTPKTEKVNFNYNALHNKDFSDDEQGQIHEKQVKIDQSVFNDFAFQGLPSISNLGDHIRPLTLTRNRIVDLLNSRRFQQLVKGCFVRYLIDSNVSSTSNSYIIAQIVGVTEGNKEYLVNGVKTKVLLKLQQTSQNVVTLSLQLISNQHPPGGLEIEKWLQTNRNKIPKQKQLKQKLDQHNKLLVEQLSSGEIDSNIWKKAKRVAQQSEQLKQDINPLLDFVSEKLHNLQVSIEEEKIGRNAKGDLPKLEKEHIEVKFVYEKLRSIRENILKNRPLQKKSDFVKKQKKYSLHLMQQKRKDTINEKCKAKNIMLTTYEGCVKLKQTTLENHMKYNFQLDEEDMAY